MLGQGLDRNDDDGEERSCVSVAIVNDRDDATLVWVVLGQKEIRHGADTGAQQKAIDAISFIRLGLIIRITERYDSCD